MNESLQNAVKDACEELAEEEKSCCWPRYMLLCLPVYVAKMNNEQKRAAWEELKKLDSMRAQYYEYEIQRI